MHAATMRVEAVTVGGLTAVKEHNNRDQEYAERHPHIDSERTRDNCVLFGTENLRADVLAATTGLKQARAAKTMADNKIAAELMLTAHADYFKGLTPAGLQEWVDSNLAWLQAEFDAKVRGRLVSAVLHLDEQAPHIHAVIVPIVAKSRKHPVTKQPMPAEPRLNFEEIFGDTKAVTTRARMEGRSHLDTKLGRLQTSYAQSLEHMGLVRGQLSMRTQEPDVKHVAPHVYRQIQGQLEELERQRRELSDHYKKLENQRQSLKAEVIKLENTEKALKKDCSQLESDCTRLESERANTEQRLKETESKLEPVETRVKAGEERLAALNAEAKKYDVDAMKTRYNTELAGLRKSYAGEKSKLESEIAKVKQELTEEVDLKDRVVELRDNRAAEAEQLSKTLEETQLKVGVEEARLAAVGVRIEEAHERLVEVQKQEPVTAWQTACMILKSEASKKGISISHDYVADRLIESCPQEKIEKILLAANDKEHSLMITALNKVVEAQEQAQKQEQEQKRKQQVRRSQSLTL